MANRYVRVGVAALCLSVITAFATTPGSWESYRFRMGNFDREGEQRAISETLKLFNATFAGFYASGGLVAGLNMFPADNLIKRRIFQDLNIIDQKGLVQVMDRDRSDLKAVVFSDRNHATAVMEEAWFLQYQDKASRRPRSGKKADLITVRYFLKKMWGKWIVVDYAVYGRNDSLPPVQHERFVTW